MILFSAGRCAFSFFLSEFRALKPRRNQVSLFYEEKFLMLLNFCQTFALMRMLSQSWAWPPFWRRWTAPMLLFNFDTPAFYYRDADDGTEDLCAHTQPASCLWCREPL